MAATALPKLPSNDDDYDSDQEFEILPQAYNSDEEPAEYQPAPPAPPPNPFEQDNDNDDTPPPPHLDENALPTALQDSTTSGTPEPHIGRSPVPPPPSMSSKLSKHNSIPPPPPSSSKSVPHIQSMSHHELPPPPSYSQMGAMQTYKSDPTIIPSNIPKRERSGRAKSPGPPPKIHNKHVMSQSEKLNLGSQFDDNDDDKKLENLDYVSFTDILRQVDVGIEMTDRLKEVIRKFCKHQQMGADKLQEIYGKLPSTYQANDGMKEFADLCALVHTLILETVSAQKRMADFLHKDVVPKMDSYIKEKQQQLQQLKRDNQQSEMKLKNSINSMNKAANTAKNSAVKAKQAVIPKRRNTKDHDKKGGFGKGFKSLKSKISGKKDEFADLSEEEQVYMRAAQQQKNYEAAVMAANYEQDTYYNIQSRFKRDCRGFETQRMQYCQGKIQQMVNAHRQYFNDEKIMVLQTRILSSLESLDENKEYNNFLENVIVDKGKSRKPKAFKNKKFDYQNVFHSLQDSMDITNKLAPHAKLPLMLTTLCNKVRELNGFDTEGIFRKSAAATEIDRIKIQLSSNNYTINTKDPHVPAGLLKDWLRGLKDSLIPQSHYDICISMAKKNEIKAEALDVFLSQLPEVNRETIKYLVKFLNDLIEQKHIPKTKMNLENVSIVFAPTILKCPHTDPQILLQNSRHEKTFTIALIKELSTF